MSTTGYAYNYWSGTVPFSGASTTSGWTTTAASTVYYSTPRTTTIPPEEEKRDEVLDKLFQWEEG